MAHQLGATNKMIKCSYTWTVTDCGEFKPCERNKLLRSRTSPAFTTNVTGEILKWKLKVNYDDKQHNNYDYKNECMYLYLLALSEEPTESAISFTIHLTNNDGKTGTMQTKLSYDNRPYSFKTILETDFGFPYRVSDRKVSVQDRYQRYITVNDTDLQGFSVTIICNIFFEVPTFSYNHVDNSINFSTDHEVVECGKIEEFFESGKLSDVTIVTGDDEFRAHKLILSLRSKVFSAMFTHDMEEKSKNLVTIVDVEADVMREMLRFMYTGKVQDIDRFAVDLLAVAEKYEIQDLKSFCEEKLIEGVNLENFHETFALADLHRAEKLKKHMIEFLSKQVDECSKIMANRQ